MLEPQGMADLMQDQLEAAPCDVPGSVEYVDVGGAVSNEAAGSDVNVDLPRLRDDHGSVREGLVGGGRHVGGNAGVAAESVRIVVSDQNDLGGCRRDLCWNSIWRNLQRHEVIVSGSDVNRLIDGWRNER